jgi:hypothetical protein
LRKPSDGHTRSSSRRLSARAPGRRPPGMAACRQRFALLHRPTFLLKEIVETIKVEHLGIKAQIAGDVRRKRVAVEHGIDLWDIPKWAEVCHIELTDISLKGELVLSFLVCLNDPHPHFARELPVVETSAPAMKPDGYAALCAVPAMQDDGLEFARTGFHEATAEGVLAHVGGV